MSNGWVRLVAWVALAASAFLVLYPARSNSSLAVATIRNDWSFAWSTTPEARRIFFYGDRTGLGYGYVRDVLQGYPAPDTIPEIRNPRRDEMFHLFLPGRMRRRDDRMLIGVGIPDADLAESVIATATRVKEGHGRSLWQFATGTYVDTFIGLDLFVSGASGALPAGKVELIASPNDPTILASGATSEFSEARGCLKFRPTPVRPFSSKRGGRTFLVSVSGVTPRAIEVVAIRNDLNAYEILNRDRGCFVAARKDPDGLLPGQERERWLAYFKRLRGAAF